MLVHFFLFATLAASALGHTYHLGSCPNVEPVPNFEMDRFLGKWYVIQKTTTFSKCVTYDFTAGPEPHEYDLEQVSMNPILGLGRKDSKYHYTGHLTTPDWKSPAKMEVKFRLNVIGGASYTVFATDYNTYGAVFTCQKVAFTYRQSATILSRKETLEGIHLNMIRQKLSAFGVDPHELKAIDQANCPEEDEPTPTSGDDIDIRLGTGDQSGKGEYSETDPDQEWLP